MKLRVRLFAGLVLACSFLPAACGGPPDPHRLVDRAIAVHGSEILERAEVTFDFRDRHYTARRENGRFVYARTYTDSTGAIREVLQNDGLYREVDHRRVPMTDRERRRAETGVNSVIYFALLPLNLNDPAVIKRYLGERTLEGQPYHLVEITFRPEGGGRDFDDRFLYWIHRERDTIDYLAYYFHVDEGGARFRKAVNPRTIEGVRFVDHLNYASDEIGMHDLERMAELYEAGALEMLSEIELENVRVERL